jgi:hypothetical protein
MRKISAWVDEAKRMSNPMPSAAAVATLRGTTKTLDLAARMAEKLAAAESPPSQQDAVRFSTLEDKLIQQLPRLARAIVVEADSTTADSITTQQEIGRAADRLAGALSKYEGALAPDDPKTFLLMRGLNDVLANAPAAIEAKRVAWETRKLQELAPEALRFEKEGKLDRARLWLDLCFDATNLEFYRVRKYLVEVEGHLELGRYDNAKSALRAIRKHLDRLMPNSAVLEPHPEDASFRGERYDTKAVAALIDRRIAEASAKIAAQELREPPKDAHIEYVSFGHTMVPRELASLLDAYRKVSGDMERLLELWGELRRTWDTLSDSPDPAARRRREQVGAELDRSALLVRRTEDILFEIRSAAIRKMGEFRASLIEASPVSAREAESWAEKLYYHESVPREDIARVSDTIAEIFRLTSGRGLLTAQGIFAEMADGGGTQVGFVDIGTARKRTTIFHELGHHLEYGDPRIANATRAWVLSRATDPEPKKFSELFPKVHEIVPFDDDLVGHDGDFVSMYTGRVYPRRGATEVTSTGLEAFADATKMTALALADEDHFALMLGILGKRR